MFIEENESIESQDVNQESSSESSQESQPQAPVPSQEAKAQAPADPNNNSNVPFHEHPRFKELIEEKNKYREELNAIKQQSAELQRQFQASQQPPKAAEVDKMYERLKGIDPEFAEYLKELKQTAGKATQLEAQMQEQRESQFVQTAVSQVNSLHEKNALSPALREIYNQQLDNLYMQGKIRSASDLEGAYKQIHEQYAKVIEDVRRAERESYVADKTKVAKVPVSAPRGAPARAPSKTEFSKDPNTAKSQAIQTILQQVRAEKEI